MSKRTLDTKAFSQINIELLDQYVELLGLRAKVAGLLYPPKRSPPRRLKARSKRLTTRAMQRNDRPSTPILLVLTGRQLPWPRSTIR
jgi:hypothetical protein